MKSKMKMNHKHILGKKIKVIKDSKPFFYTVEEIIDLTENYILFIDKYGEQQFCNWKNIVEVM